MKHIKYFENQYNVYYNSHGETTTFEDIMEIEVKRGNYLKEDFLNWMKKYNISLKDNCIWVTDNKKDVYKYILPSEYYDKIENGENINELLMKEFGTIVVDLFTYTNKDGFIISESNDGENGYIFIFK